MIGLIIMLGLLEVAADPAVVDESSALLLSLNSLFFGLEHVVTLLAEAHSSECSHRNSEFA
jgi:hypothetical protein